MMHGSNHKDAMLKAIKDRRGHGLDIKIILGSPGMDKDDMNKTDELAPDVKEEGMEDEHSLGATGKDQELSQMLAQEEPGHTPDHSSMDQDLYKGMEHEPLPEHKPRSLGERAKMALMHRMGKK